MEVVGGVRVDGGKVVVDIVAEEQAGSEEVVLREGGL